MEPLNTKNATKYICENYLFITYHKQFELTKYTQLVGGGGAGQQSPRNLLFTRRGSQGCSHL